MTDSAAKINEALKSYDSRLVSEAEPQVVLATPHVVVSVVHADTPEQLAETERDIEETQEERRAQYLGHDKRLRRQLRQISHLTGQRYSLQEEVAQLRAELAQYRGQQPPQEQHGQQQPRGEDNSQPLNGQAPQQLQQQPQAPQPQRKWGEFDAAELEAFKRQQDAALASFKYRWQLAQQENPDLAETISKTDVQLPEVILDSLKIVETGPQVAFFLAKNPQVAKEISDFWQRGDQQRACSMLDHVENGLRFAKQHPQRPRREPSPTPEPIRHLSGGGTGRIPRVNDPDIDYSTYKKLRDQEEFGGRGRR